MTDDIAVAILDELTTLNDRMNDLINVLREKNANTSSNGEITDAEFDALMKMHQDKIERKHSEKLSEQFKKQMEDEIKFEEKNAKLDKVLKHLGVM